MSGRSAYYVEMIANAGLVAIHTAASSRLVAPPGGAKAVLGTNPIAIAVPSSREPIVLDIGTSAYMMTEVMLRERLGELLPEGVAIGPDGEPTTRPGAGAARRIAAVRRLQGLRAGADGAGIGTARRIRPRSRTSEHGYLFIAFRPDLLGPKDVFNQRMTQLIEVSRRRRARPASTRSASRRSGPFALANARCARA